MEHLPDELQELVEGDISELIVKVKKPDTYVRGHPNGLPPKRKRKAFILNITEGTNFIKRKGAEKDTTYMTKLFEGLDFEITEVLSGDVNAETVNIRLKEFKNVCERDEVDCIVVFVGSHGAKDVIQTSDGGFLEVYKDIIYPCQFPVIAKKDGKSVEKRVVRIFINYSCQTDLPGWLRFKKAETVVMKDSIYAVAQIPKFKATRDEYCGSYYAVVLTYVFMMKAWNTPLLELFFDVQKLLPKFAECADEIQHPPIIMGLNQPFYFFKNPYDFQFEVLHPVSLFTGRKSEISELYLKFKEQSGINLDAHKVAIVGFGGMGKTQLARAFCQQFVGAVIWINAETEQKIVESFRKVATERLNISSKDEDGREKNIATIVEEVFNKFLEKSCLFVFDNVQNLEDIKEFLRFPDPNANPPYILITSRDTAWESSASTLELHVMSKEDSIELVRKGLKIEHSEKNLVELIVKLVEKLQNYPLALSIAIAFIQQQKHLVLNESIKTFMKKYELSPRVLLDGKTNADFNRYTESISKILNVTLEKISAAKYGKEAICLLKMISYFEPDKIPIEILSLGNIKEIKSASDSYVQILFSYFQKFVSYFHILCSYFWGSYTSMAIEEADGEDEVICLLTKYAVINAQPEEKTISVHRLVQEVTRLRIREENNEEVTLSCILKLFMKFKLQDLSLDLIRHSYSVYKYCSVYTSLVYEFSIFPLIILHVYDIHAKWSDVINIGAELKQILKSNRYRSEDYIIRMNFVVALANQNTGRYKISQDIYKQTFELHEKQTSTTLTEEEIIIAKGLFAVTLKHTGQVNDFLDIMDVIYKRKIALFGQNGMQTISSLVDIADCLFNQTGVKDDRFPTQDEVTAVLTGFYDTNVNSIARYSNCLTRIAEYFCRTEDFENARIIAENVYEVGKNSEDLQMQWTVWQCSIVLRDIEKAKGNHQDALKKTKECHSLFLKFARTQ